jgi:transposase
VKIPIAAARALLAERGHDGNRFRESLVLRGVLPIVRRARGAGCPSIPTIAATGTRNRVERMFGRLEAQRRLATRHGTTGLSF